MSPKKTAAISYIVAFLSGLAASIIWVVMPTTKNINDRAFLPIFILVMTWFLALVIGVFYTSMAVSDYRRSHSDMIGKPVYC